MKYITVDDALTINKSVIKFSGGQNGIENIEKLESILSSIQLYDSFPTFIDKIAQLIDDITNFHVFLDGNKRTAIALGVYLLIINEFSQPIYDHFIQEMKNLILIFAARMITIDDLKRFLIYIINGKAYSSDLEIKKKKLIAEYYKIYK